MTVFRLILLLFLLNYSLHGEDAFTASYIQQVASLHNQALKGSYSDVLKAEDVINTALTQNPTNQLLHAYLGSLLTIKSSKACLGLKKINYLKTGLKMMDQAVEAAPNDAAVRLVRAMNNTQLPAFFNRRDDAREDFKQILYQIETVPETSNYFNSNTRQAIYYYSGQALLKDRQPLEAKQVWEKGMALGKNTDWGKKLAKALQKVQKKTCQLTQS